MDNAGTGSTQDSEETPFSLEISDADNALFKAALDSLAGRDGKTGR